LDIMPDLSVPAGQQMPLFIHRSLRDAEIYFVANPTQEKIIIDPEFRVNTDLAPQLWNPIDGTVRNLPQFTPAATGQGISVPLQLEPLESAFVVFRKGLAKSEGVNYPEPNLVADLSASKWNISFDASRRGPADPLVVDSLFDWSTSSDMAIANYSGKAVYKTDFTLDALPEGHTCVDLGNVMVMAKVKVNGEYAGGAWTHPYRVDITPLLKQGDNSIEVEVVNNWRNRLIGDAALPEADRLTWTNFELVNAAEPLQSSGLLGPVRILSY
ncbi:MAG: glycoside hydrolase family 2, partial [Muribaculaceae bacterium]|nr:glycoside hydrolase family 2 [Muribaculaceae bacterium]